MSSPKAKAYYRWLSWIVKKNMPLSSVEDEDHCLFSVHKIKISTRSLVKLMNKIVEKVENMIKKTIAESKAFDGRGAILHDGWSSGPDQYVGLFLSFTRQIKAFESGKEIRVPEPQVLLLACSPMDHHNDENGATHEAITFNAEQHVEFFEETLKFYGLSFGDKDKFITNQIADNAMVNKRVAQILGPHVGCANHKFNLEIEAYLKKDFEDVIEHTRATMVAIANSTKNRALLRTMTDKSPLYYNDTRWYGKYFMVKCWLELFDFVKEANKLIQEHEGRRAKQIPLNIGAAFKPKVEACKSYLESFHKTQLAMEKQGATLEACREHLDTWVYAMTYPSNNEAEKLYGCGLGTKWIASNANIVTDCAFEQGVVKIQGGEHYLHTDMEKEAVASLLQKDNEATGSISESESGTDNEDDDPVSPCTRAENNKRQRLNAKQHVQSPYVNCDYILGSVAEVEQLWSLAKYVIPDHRKKSHPIHVEALLFLKVNRSFWDVQMVHETLLELNMM